MKARLIEHALSILFVTCAFIVVVTVVTNREAAEQTARTKAIEPYLGLDFLDFGNPLHAALFREALGVFHPDTPAKNDSLLQAIQTFRQEQFTRGSYKRDAGERGLSAAKLTKLGGMYGRFILLYVVVMILTYHAAQSLAIYRFVKMKQNKTSYLGELYERISSGRPGQRGLPLYLYVSFLLAKAFAKGISYAVLFAPAYVIAYAIRTKIDTDSYLFLIALAVVSNGLLINYANKFFTFLTAENRKGYVQTAIVKNLDASYRWGTPDGVSFSALLRPKHMFPSHVFRHLYLNARYQYLPALKEHASFLITGLIIIEMALNIQGHLGYELLQNILYRQYDAVVAIILGIFLVVKATEFIVDWWFFHESKKYENKVES